MKFLKNNIGFRRDTAGHFAQFFQTKEWVLSEVIDSDKHAFNPTARELLLQYFSAIHFWLVDIERDFIKAPFSESERSDHCAKSFLSYFEEFKEMVFANPDDFKPEYVKIWMELRDEMNPILASILGDRARHQDMSIAFGEIMAFCLGLMTHTLFNLHELDFLLNYTQETEEKKFVYVDRFDVSLACSDAVSLLNMRLAKYCSYGLLGRGDNLIMKKQFDDIYLMEDFGRDRAFKEMNEIIESRGLLLDEIV